MLDTERSLYEIEVALANYFEYLKTNIIVFNVTGKTIDIPIYHECDCLVCSKDGYLTEVEIKRSWSDFLHDFKKRTQNREPVIKKFYYCVPEKLLDKVYEKLDEECENNGFLYSGIITYDENLRLNFHGKRVKSFYAKGGYHYLDVAIGSQKIYLEQKLAIARLGCIKTIKEKKKVIDYQNNTVVSEDNESIVVTEEGINNFEENEIF